MKLTKRLLLPGMFMLFSALVACGPSKNLNKDYVYFQNSHDSVALQVREPVFQPNDLISIQVFSKTPNQEQAAVFNLRSNAGSASTSGNPASASYQVSAGGNIDLPIIGSVKAEGLTKDQLAQLLAQKLTPYVKDPIVLVKYQQYNVNVLGEVRSPGAKPFSSDRVTIIDAISAAGDLTDYGKRNDILVIREEAGKRFFYNVDLRSSSLFQSPAYFLRPNDIVYVGPNNRKLQEMGLNPVAQRRSGLVISLISVATSLVTLIVTLNR